MRYPKTYYIFFILSGVLGLYALLMPLLRLYSLNASVFDLGVYDHLAWNFARHWDWISTMHGHFRPVTMGYGLIYKVLASPYVLITLQWMAMLAAGWILYLIAKRKRNASFAAFVLTLYLINSCVLNIIFFDFHADHLIVLTFMLVYYLLDKPVLTRWDKAAIVLLCVFSWGFKEPLILSVIFMGLTIAWYKREKTLGLSIAAASLIFFYLLFHAVYPALRGTEVTTQVLAGEYNNLNHHFAYLGNSVSDVLRILFTDPGTILAGIFNDYYKGVYILALFLPLAFLPFFSPSLLLPALPAIGISLLSTNPNHYTVVHHYTAAAIAPLFVAFVHTYAKLDPQRPVAGYVLGLVLAGSLFVSWAFAPLPYGRLFYKQGYNYHYSMFIPTPRSQRIKKLIAEHIPKDQELKVSLQNNLFHPRATQKKDYSVFPRGLANCDYVVLDTRRAPYVVDNINKDLYRRHLQQLKSTWDQKVDYDGFYIFKK